MKGLTSLLSAGFDVSASENAILVGAPLSVSSEEFTCGAAYHFVRYINESTLESTWNEESKFFDDVNATDECFGSSVFLSEDGLMMFGAVPYQVEKQLAGSDRVNSSGSIGRVFSFIPDELRNSNSKNKKSSSSSPDMKFLKPLLITMGVMLAILPIAVLVAFVYRKHQEASSRGEPLDEQDDSASRGAPVLRISPLQSSSSSGGASDDIEAPRNSGDGESPAGTPQGLGQRQKNGHKAFYTELGVTEENGTIWSSIRNVFVPPPSQASAVSTPQSSERPKRNPMTIPKSSVVST